MVLTLLAAAHVDLQQFAHVALPNLSLASQRFLDIVDAQSDKDPLTLEVNTRAQARVTSAIISSNACVIFVNTDASKPVHRCHSFAALNN